VLGITQSLVPGKFPATKLYSVLGPFVFIFMCLFGWLVISVLFVCAVLFVFKTGSHYVVQTDLKLKILLPQPPECWDYRCAPPHPFMLFFFFFAKETDGV
jgi:hypothetical protein